MFICQTHLFYVRINTFSLLKPAAVAGSSPSNAGRRQTN